MVKKEQAEVNEKEFRELYERVARLEKSIENGLKDDISELKERTNEIHSILTSIVSDIAHTKTMQKVQWWFITAILATIVTSFVKFFTLR